MKTIKIEENHIFIQWQIEDNGDLKLLHFSPLPFCEESIAPESIPERFQFIGMNLSGFDRPYERHGNSYVVTAPGYRMKYIEHEDTANAQGRRIVFHTADEETQVHVFSYVQFYDGLSIIRIWHRVENRGSSVQTLDYIANFNYEGFEKEGELSRDEKMRLWIPHNSWQRELNAEAGCEYYCIDAGWYADGYWWDNVGEWKVSKARFPEGLKKVTDHIRSFGMVPGLWLEPEVMGIHCKMASEVSDEWFFIRHKKRVYDRSRFQLDYRNPEVREYMTGIIDRLVNEYGIGYIKTDYNIEPGIGTELHAESFGEGMLEHERAYLAWLEDLHKKYPELVIENCSSGGLRMDYAMLSQCSIQSTSDQDDYVNYSVIAANAPTGVTPEQAAVWAYPMNHESEVSEEELREETIFNMVNAMLLRIHQSGHLAALDGERKSLVKEGIRVYKSIRDDIKDMVPFWPLGLADYEDTWVSMGLKSDKKAYLAVWKRKQGSGEIELPLTEEFCGGQKVNVRCVYPKEAETAYEYDSVKNVIRIKTDKKIIGRLFRIETVILTNGKLAGASARVL